MPSDERVWAAQLKQAHHAAQQSKGQEHGPMTILAARKEKLKEAIRRRDELAAGEHLGHVIRARADLLTHALKEETNNPAAAEQLMANYYYECRNLVKHVHQSLNQHP